MQESWYGGKEHKHERRVEHQMAGQCRRDDNQMISTPFFKAVIYPGGSLCSKLLVADIYGKASSGVSMVMSLPETAFLSFTYIYRPYIYQRPYIWGPYIYLNLCTYLLEAIHLSVTLNLLVTLELRHTVHRGTVFKRKQL